ncbi:MAG: hypothetical protein BWX48_00044 [Verrucomicrobia bacterium ADurb.Bin006]|nr:MAG: hypothetical protein BWX48_00044 [Verrucomicrobia bacterium ADurb.Bin006]
MAAVGLEPADRPQTSSQVCPLALPPLVPNNSMGSRTASFGACTIRATPQRYCCALSPWTRRWPLALCSWFDSKDHSRIYLQLTLSGPLGPPAAACILNTQARWPPARPRSGICRLRDGSAVRSHKPASPRPSRHPRLRHGSRSSRVKPSRYIQNSPPLYPERLADMSAPTVWTMRLGLCSRFEHVAARVGVGLDQLLRHPQALFGAPCRKKRESGSHVLGQHLN